MPTNQQGLNSGGLRSGGLRRTLRHGLDDIPDDLIDSFEDANVDEYGDYEHYAGRGAFDVIESGSTPTARDGTHVLHLTDTGGDYPKMMSTSGLVSYPSKGDEFSVWTYIGAPVGSSGSSSGTSDTGFYFGCQDLQNTYYINVRSNVDTVYFYEKENDIRDTFGSATDVGFQQDAWYRIIVRWHDGQTFDTGTDGDITIRIEDSNRNVLYEATNTPTTFYDDGGFGFYGNVAADEDIYWDDVHFSTTYASVGAVDGFEDADLAEYTEGDTNQFQITTDAYDGQNAVASAGDGAYEVWSPPQGDLEHYPQAGDKWEFYIKCDSFTTSDYNQSGVDFCIQESQNGYRRQALVDWRDNEIMIRADDNDGTLANQTTAISDFTLQADTWYRVVVRMNSEDLEFSRDGASTDDQTGWMEAEIFDANSSASQPTWAHDDTHLHGGFGIASDRYNGEVSKIDEVHVLERSRAPLGQTEPASTEIDSFESSSFSPYSKISDSGEETFTFTDAQSTYEPIGGGPGYTDTWTSADADTVVSTADEFITAIEGAQTNEVIFVDSDIDMSAYDSDNGYTCSASGVVICGDRGVNGSPGPLIYSDSVQNKYIVLGAQDIRFTGLRFRGPQPEWSPDILHSEEEGGGDWQTDRKPYHHKGLNLNASNIEVDNCEIWGFGYGCTLADDGAHYHHNNIHHGTSEGWGYGIATTSSSDVLIEYNRFAHCRHAISDSGGGSYTTRHNLFEEPHASNIVDMHQDGGQWTDVRRNTIVTHDGDIDGRPDQWSAGYTSSGYISGYIQRHNPADAAQIYDNWMWNPLGVWSQDAPRGPGFDPDAIDQAWPEMPAPDPLEWVNVQFGNNQFGPGTIPSADKRMRDGRQLQAEGERSLVYLGSRKSLGYLSTTGLDRYPAPGDTWQFLFRWEGLKRGLAQVLFGVQSESSPQNCYELEIRENDVRLQVDVDGTDTTLGSTGTINWLSNIPYRFVVDWPSSPTDNGITISIYNHLADTLVEQFTCDPDGTYTSGGWGFYGNSWAGFMIDDVHVVE